MRNSPFLYVLVVIFSSCSTIFTGTSQRITVRSEPAGATIYVDGNPEANTPSDIRVKKGVSHEVLVQKNGYRSNSHMLSNNKIHWTAWLNILNLQIGYYLDAATGASSIFTDNYFNSKLIQEAKQIKSSDPINCSEVILEIKDGEYIGKKLKKGNEKGGIFYGNDVKINKEIYKKLVENELSKAGFTINEHSDLSLKMTITNLSFNRHRHRKNIFSTKSEVNVSWELISNSSDKTLLNVVTTGTGSWNNEGSTSIELAFKQALFLFLLEEKFYQKCNTVSK